MTSNVGADDITKAAPELHKMVAATEGKPAEYARYMRQFTSSLTPALQKAFKRNEFLGRINEIVVFLPLTAVEVKAVVEGELEVWKKRAKEEHEIRLEWTPLGEFNLEFQLSDLS